MSNTDRPLTAMLEAAATGDGAAAEELLPLVYAELRRLARARLRGAPVTLDATALVHEAYLRLVDGDRVGFRGRNHFFAAAALAIRHVLVDRARRRARLKRGGGAVPVTLTTAHPVEGQDPVDLLALDLALDRLAETAPRCARVVTLRYFAGLGNREIAAVLGVSDATVERDWRFAKAWLHRELSGAGDG